MGGKRFLQDLSNVTSDSSFPAAAFLWPIPDLDGNSFLEVSYRGQNRIESYRYSHVEVRTMGAGGGDGD